MFRHVIFDCDGVLVDSEPLSMEVDRDILAENGITMTIAEVGAQFIGLTFEAFIARIEAEHRIKLPPDVSEDKDRRLLALSIEELAAAQEQLLLLGRKTAEERLVSFLILLSQNQVRRGLVADPITLPMTRSDIADYLGLTIETVSRTLSSLKKKGLIELEDTTHVHLVDRDRLEDLAAGFA